MDPYSRVREKDTSYRNAFEDFWGISYRDHVTNDEVRNRIRQAIGPYEDLLTTVKKTQTEMVWSAGLAKMILQGTVQVGRRKNREEWRKMVAQSFLVPQRSTRLWYK